MTSPIAAFLEGLAGGAEQGSEFRYRRDTRRQAQAEHADDRTYEQARRLREGVAAGLQAQNLQGQIDDRRLDNERQAEGQAFQEQTTLEGLDLQRQGLENRAKQDARAPKLAEEEHRRNRLFDAEHPIGGGEGAAHYRPGSPEHRAAWIPKRAQELVDNSGHYAGEDKLSPRAARQQAEAEYSTFFGLDAPLSHAPSPGHVPGHAGRLRSSPHMPLGDSTPAGRAQSMRAEGATPDQEGADSVATQQAAWDRAAQHLKATRPGTDPASVLGPRP